MQLINRKTVAGAIVAVAVLVGAVAAYAYFTSSGTGSGSATVGSASPWVIGTTASSGGPLLPGSGTETFTYTVTNSSDGQQQLNAVTVTVADDGSGNVLDTAASNAAVVGCLASWFTVDNTGAPDVPATIAGGGSVIGSADVTLTDSGTNQDPCQGVEPELIVTAS